jgi:hypothetical protein
MVVLLLSALAACTQTSPPEHYTSQALDDKWLQGQAEVATYALSQNRYQATHPGQAVVITVSEPWLPATNVKADGPASQSATVLKTNQIRRFTTGIYDYSIFTSAFVQPDGYLEKVTSSSQDWCGQGWLQMIGGDGAIDVEQRSYFASEGDRTASVSSALSEDALFNLIRINPDLLPEGSVAMVPAGHIIHMRHLPLESYEATIAKTVAGDTSQISISWPQLDRQLSIKYATAQPHTIYGWTDRYPSAFDKQVRETVATLIDTIWTAYWSLNSPQDTTYRQPLGLD